jgi:hypothetical protein
MSYSVRCWTLFDITYTAIINRNKPPADMDIADWTQKRNTQANFDTVLQAISLRSQPEVIEYPIVEEITFNHIETKFGFMYMAKPKKKVNVWKFLFSVQHPSVFNDGITDFGGLYSDCHGIPMLKSIEQLPTLIQRLDTSNELRNIYFEVIK